MDKKDSPSGKRLKRSAKPPDDLSWDCSVCTYKNTAEAFKCMMCHVRKGTSTRKPRVRQELQQVQTYTPPPPPPPPPSTKNRVRSDKKETKPAKSGRTRAHDIDRSHATHQEVTINNVTVVITEFHGVTAAAATAGSGKTCSSSSTSAAAVAAVAAAATSVSGASTADTSSLSSESDRHSEASNGPPDSNSARASSV